MEPLYSSVWAWCSWVIIGIIVACLSSYFLPGKRMIVLDIVIGVFGAIIGGWSSALAIGDHTAQAFTIAALVAMFICGAVLCIYNQVLIKFIGKNNKTGHR